MKHRAMRDTWMVLICLAAFYLLIKNAAAAADSARDGLKLCLQTLIPSLFPLLFMTKLLMATSFPKQASRVLGPIVRNLFLLPEQCASAIVLGAVGGYPIGAKTACLLYKEGSIEQDTCEQLLCFCSNAGSAFVFGVIGTIFNSIKIAAVLYVIHISSAVITGILLRKTALHRKTSSDFRFSSSSSEAVLDSVKTMAVICGYIILFRILRDQILHIAALSHSPVLSIMISGFLELTGGFHDLNVLDSVGARYCFASAFLSFGGLCVLMQTKSVLRGTQIPISSYIFGKSIQCAISVLITWTVIFLAPSLLPMELPVSTLPNHTGLLESTGLVTACCLIIFGIWCVYLRKRAGKNRAGIV